MTAFVTDWDVAATPPTINPELSSPVVLVVGFDGSEPAQRALEAAAQLLHGRDGELEIVYVACLPAAASLGTAEAVTEIENSFDQRSRQLLDEIHARLDSTEPRWHYQRRDGTIAHELMAVADDLRQRHGPAASIVIVLGGSAHKYHRIAGSASLNVVRHDRFPVVVIP